MNRNFKKLQDSVHNVIILEGVLVKIIDTSEFQRLRNIKQLETITYVYPCANHTRFEHSIGTSHLAEKMVEHLIKHQPELNIDQKDALCVKIAGLCHDLGHGPFSHLFESLIARIHLARHPECSANDAKSFFQHEKASSLIFDRIFAKLKDTPEFKEAGLAHQDKEFIKELIKPTIIVDIDKNYKKLKLTSDEKEKAEICKEIERLDENLRSKCGRNKDKSFLFEIVSNFRTQIDVDKWDYFARDAHNLGIKETFNYERYMSDCRVINPDETLLQICARDSELRDIYEMFRTREDLYKRAYQNSKVVSVKEMTIDALIYLDSFYGFYEIAKDLDNKIEDYLNLDDRILYAAGSMLMSKLNITKEQQKDLEKSKEIIDRLESRKLYKLIAYEIVSQEKYSVKKATENLIVQMNNNISKEDFVITELKLNYGSGGTDPVENLNLYKKHNFQIVDKKTLPEYRSKLRPCQFQEITWNLYIKKEILLDQEKALSDAFLKICREA